MTAIVIHFIKMRINYYMKISKPKQHLFCFFVLFTPLRNSKIVIHRHQKFVIHRIKSITFIMSGGLAEVTLNHLGHHPEKHKPRSPRFLFEYRDPSHGREPGSCHPKYKQVAEQLQYLVNYLALLAFINISI